jgi:methylthioribose-1-phosphate isomerase
MRIIAGRFRRRKLRTNPGLTTRPITDRAKEPLFAHLASVLADARVADVFAGTGTLGLEALSRGAKSVVFLEQDRQAVELLRENVETLGVAEECLCWQTDAVRSSFRPHNVPQFVPFDVIFFDPPYGMLEGLHPGGLLFRAVERLARSTVSAPDAILCLRAPVRAEFEVPAVWDLWKTVRVSSMAMHLYRKRPPRSEESETLGRERSSPAESRAGTETAGAAVSGSAAPVAFRSPLRWEGDALSGHLVLLDQTRLPVEEVERDCRTAADVWEAIRALRVRGAPAIGVAAAYGVVLGVRSAAVEGDRARFESELRQTRDMLAGSRPTAVNLFWALDRMLSAAGDGSLVPGERVRLLLEEAQTIEREDREMCAAIGRHGAELLRDGHGVLTHCNAGGLATAGDGTALAVIFAAAAQGKRLHVFADETRPLLQGARLTTWELMQRNVPVTLICDSMAGWVMKEGKVQAVITGADRIAANGDAANKIGTYGVALLARAHGIPFYVAAPSSTFDLSLPSGDAIPIEVRDAAEITHGLGRQTAPAGVGVYNPAFDVTPARLIDAIVTERGLIRPVRPDTVAALITGSHQGPGP